MKKLVIIGRGSHANGIATIIDAINANSFQYEIFGYLDDNYSKRSGVIGPIDTRLPKIDGYVIAINDSKTRRAVNTRIRLVADPIQLIHPSAVVGGGTHLTGGNVIQAGVVITGNVTLGSHTHVNVGATISQGCEIGSYVTISPGVNIAGEVRIGQAVQIGTGAAIVNRITIGANATVGAGAVVINDVPEGATVVGVPAKVIKYDADTPQMSVLSDTYDRAFLRRA